MRCHRLECGHAWHVAIPTSDTRVPLDVAEPVRCNCAEIATVNGLLVEGRLHAAHRVEVGLAVDPRHECVLLESDAVLSRKRAAHLDDRAQHLLAGGLDLLPDGAVAQVEKDVGVQVAVTGVEHVGYRQLVVVSDLADLREDLGQA